MNRLRAGVRIQLIIEYDTQNIRSDGLDFEAFIQAGGELYACREAGLMHHKFALADDRMLLSGSFNWTYNSNAENIIFSDDPELVRAFQEEFERLRTSATRIFQINSADAKVFSAFPLFENTDFHLTSLRKSISAGARVWLVLTERLGIDKNLIFRENYLPFDANGLLAPYWNVCRVWDETWFEEETGKLRAGAKAGALRDLRCWAKRVKTGDLILAAGREKHLLAIGIVQSKPCPFGKHGFSSLRQVQWIKTWENTPCFLDYKPRAAIMSFRGSALKLLDEVFRKPKP
jgi:hypothetical protein